MIRDELTIARAGWRVFRRACVQLLQLLRLEARAERRFAGRVSKSRRAVLRQVGRRLSKHDHRLRAHFEQTARALLS